jgi:phosphoribosylamine--glycine ligase
MKVLVIGSGGREHALVWKLRQSPRVDKVYCVPGNGGIVGDAECVPGDVKSVESLLAVAHQLQPDLTVVGPEVSLQMGVVDEFTQRGLRIFGPTRAAAQLESSKSFAKQFMQRHNIPTAPYAICQTVDEVREALPHFHAPLVVKADGLAAGKGVVICKSKDEAAAVCTDMLSGKMLGEAGSRVVLEECLEGEEISFLVVSDGERVAPLVAAQDHKRIDDGDTGPNTGGMGAYSTPALVDDKMRDWLINHIARPVVAGMKQEEAEYKGVLYCGLMMTARGPMVLEFNCRFGDPETQPLMMRLQTDLVDVIIAMSEGKLDQVELAWDKRPALCVVATSKGYPGEYPSGVPITGIEEADAMPDVKVFHSGTKMDGKKLVTDGGRVLGVTALGNTYMDARRRAYAALQKIHFDGMHYRKDIGYQALKS